MPDKSFTTARNLFLVGIRPARTGVVFIKISESLNIRGLPRSNYAALELL